MINVINIGNSYGVNIDNTNEARAYHSCGQGVEQSKGTRVYEEKECARAVVRVQRLQHICTSTY